MIHKSGGMRIGVAWYAEAEWEKLRQAAADPDTLETTYAEWELVYQEGRRGLTAQGILTERVEVKVDDLVAWCKRERRRLDSSARAAFVTEVLSVRYSEKRLW